MVGGTGSVVVGTRYSNNQRHWETGGKRDDEEESKEEWKEKAWEVYYACGALGEPGNQGASCKVQGEGGGR